MQQRYRTLSVAVETDDVSKSQLLFMNIPYEGSKLQSRKQNDPKNISALSTTTSFVIHLSCTYPVTLAACWISCQER
ncbi:hypothetical protein T10_12653 [Trichinella papuae]|uniref:Uncharacterized protein n=1 Tax=Trichinella papuae TaxID=268474 RepID=A0A0V1MMU8_9BILA|nr:hypothetical protein T10_12653 [Trichinella papuae]